MIHSYLIGRVEKLEKGIKVYANLKSVDDQKRIIIEGFSFEIPSLRELKELEFCVTRLKMKDDETFMLSLHTHQGDCCSYDTVLEVSRQVLSKWMDMSGRDIEGGCNGVSAGYTYNVLAKMPRLVKVFLDRVEVHMGTGETIASGLSVCRYLFGESYPLDKN